MRVMAASVLLMLALAWAPTGARADDATPAAAPDAFEPFDAYDTDRYANVGGPIERVAFEDAYTLLVLRVVGVREFVYLPPRAALEDAGIDTARLLRDALVEVDGYPHHSNRHKVWATSLAFL